MTDTLEHYLGRWGLSNPQPLAQTATSTVYTVQHQGETAVLKLLTPIGIQDEASGAVALRHYNGQGAVKLFEHDGAAHLMEYVEGGVVATLVEQGKDAEATQIIAGVLNQLHSAPLEVVPDGLWMLKRRFQALFNKAEQDKQAGIESVYRRAAPLAEDLLNNQREPRVLHGDMHHDNVAYSPARGWLAYDPKGVYGERTYDTANVLCNPYRPHLVSFVHNEQRLLNNAGILAEVMKIDLRHVLCYTFIYACLSASWSIEDSQEATYALRIAEIVEPHVI